MVQIERNNAHMTQIFYYCKLYFKTYNLNECSNCIKYTYPMTSEKDKDICIVLRNFL